MRCTWSAATPAPRRTPRPCTSSAPTNGARARRRAAEQGARCRRRVARPSTPGARRARPARSLPMNATYRAFAAAFPFEETADQHDAIEAVRKDMASERPMDRVVCGDVGFSARPKSPLRAAFVAVQAGKQVAVLVPHHAAARAACREFPRPFRRPARAHRIAVALPCREGIARHAGAAGGRPHRHPGGHAPACCMRMRASRTSASSSSMKSIASACATRRSSRPCVRKCMCSRSPPRPSPRTLNMAMGGLRELSLITTPPAGRVAIRTTMGEWHAPTIREAAMRELRRGRADLRGAQRDPDHREGGRRT